MEAPIVIQPSFVATSVLVSVKKIALEPAPTLYAPSRSLSVRWVAQELSPRTVNIAERSLRISSNAEEDWYFDADLEVKNTGCVAITHIQVRIDMQDEAGKTMDTFDLYAVSDGDPSILPGSVRQFRAVHITRGRKPTSYSASILDIK